MTPITNMTFHIIPYGEDHADNVSCKCNPEIYNKDGFTIVHHQSLMDDKYIENLTFQDILRELDLHSEDITPPNQIMNLKGSYLLDPDNINPN